MPTVHTCSRFAFGQGRVAREVQIFEEPMNFILKVFVATEAIDCNMPVKHI